MFGLFDTVIRHDKPAPIKHSMIWHIQSAVFMFPLVSIFLFFLYFHLIGYVAGFPVFSYRRYFDSKVDLFFRIGSRDHQFDCLQFIEYINSHCFIPQMTIASLISGVLVVIYITNLIIDQERKTVIHRGQQLDTKNLINQLNKEH
jgi:hypothetical protein